MSVRDASKASAFQRYLNPDPAPPAGGQAAAAATAEDRPLERKSYCILRGRFQPLLAVRLINRQGRVRSFDYGQLAGVTMDRPDELLLHIEGQECYTVSIQGKDLDAELLEALDNRRVLWVSELDELEAAGVRKEAPAEPVVTLIRISKGSVSREW